MAGGFKSIKDLSDHIGNRPRQFPACSGLPQPNAQPPPTRDRLLHITIISILVPCNCVSRTLVLREVRYFKELRHSLKF